MKNYTVLINLNQVNVFFGGKTQNKSETTKGDYNKNYNKDLFI